jgi:PleD family two-component response regulator
MNSYLIHDGLIQVASEKAGDSTFTVYLPASGKVESPDITAREELVRGMETILFIDDEEMILDVGKQMIESLGYSVMTANSGREGIALYMENQEGISLVILDMIMPELGGGDTFSLSPVEN